MDPEVILFLSVLLSIAALAAIFSIARNVWKIMKMNEELWKREFPESTIFKKD